MTRPGYPYKRVKTRAVVKELGDRWAWVEIDATGVLVGWVAREWLPAAIQEGQLISMPARRDARWIVTPIPPWTDTERRRAQAKGRIWANKVRHLFDDDPQPTVGAAGASDPSSTAVSE